MKFLKGILPGIYVLLLLTALPTHPAFRPSSNEAAPTPSPLMTNVDRILDREAQDLPTSTRSSISQIVNHLAQEYRLDPLLILAVMKVESTFNPKAISNAKAYGLMQVRSIVVKAVAGDLGINPNDSGRLLTSHEFNIRVGVHYLAGLIKEFGGDVKKALMAYNAGPTTVARLYKNRPAPEGGYQGKVLRTYRAFSDS